jgi:DNA-binding transcriptional regulator YiaG
MKTEAQKTLSELKEKHQVSDEKIAVKLGVSAVTIYRWRLGKFEPSFTELKMLQRILRGYQNANL